MEQRILIVVNRVKYLIDVEQIVYINADMAYCSVMMQDGMLHRIAKTMKAVLKRIEDKNLLVSVHRSWAVNINHIDKMDFINKVSDDLLVQGKFHVPVNKELRKVMVAAFQKEFNMRIIVQEERKLVPKKKIPKVRKTRDQLLKDLITLPQEDRLLIVERIIETLLHTEYEQNLMNYISVTIKQEPSAIKIENK